MPPCVIISGMEKIYETSACGLNTQKIYMIKYYKTTVILVKV